MSDVPARVLRQYLRAAVPAPVADGDLLARYAATRDEAAFAEFRPPPRADAKGDVATLWEDLASDDAAKAYAATTSVAARGDAATEFLKAKLVPVPRADAKEVAKWVADLDSNRFAVREAATKALTNLGPLARSALEAARAKKPGAEAGERIDGLLARLQQAQTGPEARDGRAVQVLSWVYDAAARKLLADLAAGVPGALLTEAARQAIRARGD